MHPAKTVNPWPSSSETEPHESWWLKPQTREEFDAHVSAQQTRMAYSRFGLTDKMSGGVDAMMGLRKE